MLLADIVTEGESRLGSGVGEFDRVLGGGIVPGELILLGGDPGIGKSTLLLQSAAQLAAEAPVLYVSGEESARQLRLRSDRIGATAPHLYILTETNLQVVLREVERLRPRVIIVDSIQTAYLDSIASSPGSITQLRECTLQLMDMAKATEIATFLVGHVTKDGNIAGPRVLEHIVDAVLYLEGERFHAHRLLRATKNRFGSTDEVGVFEMVPP
ncbi:MAG: DNA repair protein RadA, partial [Dehalococcoidia bacterium]|nr:DNA repair protein RadA [Dehalococcoidia bacterium]